MSNHSDGNHTLSQDETAAVVERARLLQQTLSQGLARSALRGKNLALVCERDDGHGALLFRQAATELGARVAHVCPSLNSESPGEEIQRTARLLGRLYDLVECQGVAPQLVRKLRSGADVPIYDGVALDTHPTAQLVDLLEVSAPWADRRRWLIQSVLLGAVG